MSWDTNTWAILLLAFLAGMFVGMFFLAGRKWKRRYKEEVHKRHLVEQDLDNWRTRSNAANDRIAVLEKERHADARPIDNDDHHSGHPVAATAGGAVAGGLIGRKLGRGKKDDLSRIRGIGPNGQERLHALGIHRYKDLEKLDDRQIAELEGSLGAPEGHVEREGWREQARLLREGKDDEQARLYPPHKS